jgi:hypothetical protein
MKKIQKMMTILLFVLFLSGCLYPNERRVENQVPHKDQIELVQRAVLEFKDKHGVLPIETKEAETPIFEKYSIDFKKLIPRFISRPPANAFEEGGIFRYVLVDVEENPTVKLIDLRLTSRVGDMQLRVNEYLRENRYLPVDQVLEGGYFTLDKEKLKVKSTEVPSPFFRNQHHLPLIANQKGIIGIDYRIDIYRTLQEKGEQNNEKVDDPRFILLEDHMFVPAHSFPYEFKNEEPVLKK